MKLNPQRELDSNDVAAFLWAAQHPKRQPKAKPRDVGELLHHLSFKYPFRMRRISRDLRWLRRKGAKYGVDV